MNSEDTENNKMSKASLDSLAKHFPGFMTGHDVDNLVYKKLVEEGFTPENTLYADCSCPDEINHDDPEEDISSLF